MFFVVVVVVLFLLLTYVRNLKPFRMNRTSSQAHQTHSTDIINTLLTSFSQSVLQVMDSRPIYGPYALCLGHKSIEQNLVHNLQYGPRTWLVRGIYERCKFSKQTSNNLVISMYIIMLYNHNNDKISNYLSHYAFNKKPSDIHVLQSMLMRNTI